MKRKHITDKKHSSRIKLSTSFVCFLSLGILSAHANEVMSPSEGIDLFVEEASWKKYSGTLPGYKTNEDGSYTEASFSIYYGDLFHIIHPKSFNARPLQPVERIDTNKPMYLRPIKAFDESEDIKPKVEPELPERYFEYINTDEAYFTSPDGLVEFFVYAKDTSNERPDYIKATDKEIQLSSESGKFSDDNEYLDYIQKAWVTIKAKDNSYYRSYIHQRACHSDEHSTWNACETQVLGIKYSNAAAYNEYRYSFIAFNRSLVRTASH